ncbi:MAG: VCBS repeat-containing protein [Gammaproteobacteria bacterium]|nr:VCBS repeat-containing protein [Gammaproteobacteria bacterium]MBT3859796.1 VCBS repeat-containing protein [Gammaproteobacteria bacterium]MBT3988809.1 VCBS repeat-containing protein [Gammaproteobacteria bacterium]MBT4254850.1 VCBS repeat-containing protein [Gammaproteobacteria bacterium]MBT4580908.1 VCBS repeat-containing protein [Gammaproteobacteria bacterium]
MNRISHKLTFSLAIYTALIFQTAHAAELDASGLFYQEQEFHIPANAESMILADMNGNGLNDIVVPVDDKIRIYFHNETGFDFETGFDEIQFPGEAVGWDISTAADDNTSVIVALIDGREVVSWQIGNGNIHDAETLKSGLSGFISRGVNRLHFSQDINNDGNRDLIIPGAGQLNLYISDGSGGFEDSIAVQSTVRIRSNLNSNELERRTGQAIRIPSMDLRDVNNDELPDLISRSDERLDVFLANDTDTSYFPREASYSLDIEEIESRLGEFDIDNLDFSNLTGVLALTHEEILDDVDGDNIDDLLLREGGKVSLYSGTKQGMDFEQPRQVLRSGGNVLSTFLYDENEDELKDLWLWRVEPISVGDIFLWLALSGSISIEAFVYPNEGERFSRRPARKLNIKLKFPSVIRLATSVREITEVARENQIQDSSLSVTANLDDNLQREDLLVMINNRIDIFLNSIEPEADKDLFLGSLGYSRQRDDYEIDIKEILDNVSIQNNPHLEAVADREASFSITLNNNMESGDIIPAKLNRDSYDDVFIFSGQDSSHIRGLLLLSSEN